MRQDGFYWLYQDDGPPFVAKHEEGYWTIIGSIFVLAEHDPDMAKYRIGALINPPRRQFRPVAAAA